MSDRLIKSALRALEAKGKFQLSQELRGYLADNAVALPGTSRVALGPKARRALIELLERDFSVPPGTRLADLEGLSRSDALSVTTNEKITRQGVRAARVAVKAAPGQVLKLRGSEIALPEGVNLDITVDDALNFAEYDRILLIENWEVFERIHLLSYAPPLELHAALVLYRGQPHGYTIGAARRFSTKLAKPVHVLPDPDPAGLHLAMTYPGFAGLALPPAEDIRNIIVSGRGVPERYLDQLPMVEQSLNACTDPEIQAYWTIFKETGRALPQEEFVR
ncbi:hypothetical protein [Thioclava sp.]|uniref:DUF7281 domain-containing protein n=1 Tax=Thioclava sp. TaxID=1933450 RepID=UPI003AA8425E